VAAVETNAAAFAAYVQSESESRAKEIAARIEQTS
jgi:hypothetical protein